MDCSLPGSSVHGILQIGTLERVAIPSSRGSSWPRGGTQVCCIAGGSLPPSHQGGCQEAILYSLDYRYAIATYPPFLFLMIFYLDFTLIYVFNCLGLSWAFTAARGLPLVVRAGPPCAGCCLWWLLLLRSTASRCMRFTAPQHVGSSWTTDQIHVPCIGRWILNPWATGEVPTFSFTQFFFLSNIYLFYFIF